MLNADEYRIFKKATASRKLPAGKIRRARIGWCLNGGGLKRFWAERHV